MKIVAKPIRMVALFSEKGAPTPLRFKVEEEGVWQIVNVDKIVSIQPVRPAGLDALIFRCQSEVYGTLKQYELVYRIKPHMWELYKM